MQDIMNMQIKPANPDDAETIMNLVADARAETYVNPELGIGDEWVQRMSAGTQSEVAVHEAQSHIRDALEHPDRRIYLSAFSGNTLTGVLSGYIKSHVMNKLTQSLSGDKL